MVQNTIPPPFKLFDRMYSNWEQWYAWHPVRIDNRWHWLTTVYRRGTWLLGNPRSHRYQYATIFGVIKA